MEMNKELKVEAGKSFSANVDQLYDAWTNPEQLKQWWKPMGNFLKEVVNDLKEGGTVKYIFDINELVISGEYLEVKEKEKLVYTWNWEFPQDAVRNARYKLSVNFAGKASGSEIKVIQENFDQEESVLPHQEGWERGLSDLEQYLNKGKELIEGEDAEASTPKAESGGYREDPAQVKVGGG